MGGVSGRKFGDTASGFVGGGAFADDGQARVAASPANDQRLKNQRYFGDSFWGGCKVFRSGIPTHINRHQDAPTIPFMFANLN